MARNIKTISQLAHQTAKELNRSPQKWMDYLQTAGRLYQYPFADQLLIYAQRPNATACTYMEQWNEKMHRWVNAGSTGIAVIRSQNGERGLGYLFDIADTHPVKGAKQPWTWQLSPEYEAVVSQAFAEQYGTVALEDIPSQLMEYAARAAAEHCKEYLSDIQYRKTNSFLEELDDQSTEVTFRNLLTASVQYMVLFRCGLNPSGYLNEDDFRAITNFNTPRMFYHLGNAVSQTGKEVLQTISRTIRNAVRTAQMQQEALGKEEGSIDNAGNHISKDGGLSDSRTRTAQIEQTGEIRSDAGAVSEAGAQRDLYRASADGGTGRAPQGDRAESDRTDGTAHQPDGKQGGLERGAQSDRSDGVDSQDEQHPAKSRRDGEKRDHLRLKEIEQITLLEAAEEQSEQETEQKAVEKSTAFFGMPKFQETDRIDNIAELDGGVITEENDSPDEVQEIGQAIKTQNFRITDEHLGEGGSKQKYQRNVQAIHTLKRIEAENRTATQEEQEVLSQYVGWGGLADAFDDRKENWKKEYAQLKELLTPEEYESARGSVLNAHFTSPTVIRAIYNAVENMGVVPGNILEPACGTGNFFGLLPESLQQSKLYGVELDDLTGRIALQLYPQAEISISGFEKTSRRDFYDLVVGNVPFGEYRVADKEYDRWGFPIHDYFLAKSIDQLRPGGIMAVVTSMYTMDKKNPSARQYLAKRADLLGAVRLPNNAFQANAGTGVTTDILFFQKRDHAPEREPDWVFLSKTEDGIPINRYFADHPQMVLGEIKQVSGRFGEEIVCEPLEGMELKAQLDDALSHLNAPDKERLYSVAPKTDLFAERSTLPADPQVRNFSYTLHDGQLYYRENSVMHPVNVSKMQEARIRGLLNIRDSARTLISLQLEGASDEAVHKEQANLNSLYDAYTNNYGLLNSLANKQAFQDDTAYPLLCSLEILNEEGKLERKADMFFKRTIQRHQPVTSVDTAAEALAVSIGEKACVDLEYMASLLGNKKEIPQMVRELEGVIFKDPSSGAFDMEQESWAQGWQTEDEYLSGNVRQKLQDAQEAAQSYPEFAVNVKALQRVQPKDLSAAEIDVRIGASWIAPEYYRQFLFELLKTPYYLQNGGVDVLYSPVSGEWNVKGKGQDSKNNALAYNRYGTKRRSAYAIFEDSLNQRDVRIFDTVTDADGKEKRVLNAKETALAQQKQEAMGEAFREWIFKDQERRTNLCQTYNTLFNSTRPREFDGSHIRFTGMNPEISLRKHQSDAVAHQLYGKNTLLAHCVGAGKTFTMIAAAMEAKRLGLCQKSLFVVPNHLTEQWGGDFLRLYPGANILVATKKDFEPANRKKFCARIATGDFDAVIIGHTQFEKIPLSPARQKAVIQNQIDEITDAIREAKENDGERYTIKQMEKTRKSLSVRLEKLNNESKKDNVVTFEELGVDRLFVDEAHFYKNLFYHTKMRNVAGIAQTEAQKSSDLFAKCRYLDEITDGRGVTFATGTPVSNSMVELYTMMRYLQFDALQERGLGHFDSWAADFGEKVTAIELSPEGTGFRSKTRFAKFYNLPELMNLWKESADIQTADMLNLPVPKAEYITVTTEPSEHQQEMVANLAERADQVRNRTVDPSIDNLLKITSDGRKLALDQRLQNELLLDDAGSKVNACVENICSVWKESIDTKGTQLVFCDLSTPHYDGTFNVYDDMKNKLIEKGIPPEEIAYIHDANTELQKAEPFAKVRKGQVRVLLGSTQKMGAGTNVQTKLIALHHLDCPWRPSDIEQREGRILRQGNENPEVKIYQYVTKGTFDAYNWGLVENKQKFIGQIMTSKSPARSAEDVDATALSYAEVKALATGDDRIREKMELDIEVSKLRMLKSSHTAQIYELEDRISLYYPQKIAQTELSIEALQKDLPVLMEHPVKDDSFSMLVSGQLYTERQAAGAAIIAACKTMTDPNQKINLGEYRGFPMTLSLNGQTFQVSMKQNLSYTAEIANDPSGNITRINHVLEKIPDHLKTQQEQLLVLQSELEQAKEEVKRPFPKEEELMQKSERLIQLNKELDLDEKQTDQAPQEEKKEKASILKALKQFETPPISTQEKPNKEVVR